MPVDYLGEDPVKARIARQQAARHRAGLDANRRRTRQGRVIRIGATGYATGRGGLGDETRPLAANYLSAGDPYSGARFYPT